QTGRSSATSNSSGSASPSRPTTTTASTPRSASRHRPRRARRPEHYSPEKTPPRRGFLFLRRAEVRRRLVALFFLLDLDLHLRWIDGALLQAGRHHAREGDDQPHHDDLDDDE